MDEAHVIATPLPGRLRLSGTLELAGLDTTISRPRIDAIRAAAGRVLSLDEREEIETWAGLRPCTPDGLPVIGRPTGVEPLILATGHARKGLSLAPITGRLVAELVTGERTSLALAPLSPDRFRPLLPSMRP
jgi:D-amino-acid dehydrogenase